MPSLLAHTDCPACGRRHHFCLPVGEVAPDREYEYVCPETAAQALLRPVRGGEAVRYYPQGAVQLQDRPLPGWRRDAA